MDNKKEIIDRIVAIEWDMCQAVNRGGSQASFKEDRLTFEAMRRAQFSAWSCETCVSYDEDLRNAFRDSRNLVAEKYVHMMKNTLPLQYELLMQTRPAPSSEQEKLAQEISDKLLKQTLALFRDFPYASGSNRPLRSGEDAAGTISIETYQLGELLTYSVKTLQSLLRHLLILEKAGKSLTRQILENSCRYYGYKTLADAERSARERADILGAARNF